jgi:AcrR family transcriptional regulator
MTRTSQQPDGGDRRAEAKARRQAERRDATRAAILDASRRVLMRQGVGGTTLDDIAAELGLTKQGLYYHYPSKEALLLSLCLAEWTDVAEAVNAATSSAATPADALEALVRTYFDRYAERLPLFRLVTQWLEPAGLSERVGPSELSRLRPLNDRMYGPTEAKLAEAQRLGLLDPALHPRRLAFVAHTSAMGLLAMKLMVETVHDPLEHGDDALLAELCRALRAAVAPPAATRATRVARTRRVARSPRR